MSKREREGYLLLGFCILMAVVFFLCGTVFVFSKNSPEPPIARIFAASLSTVLGVILILLAIAVIADLVTDKVNELLVDVEEEKSEYGFEESEEAYEEALEEALEDEIEVAHIAALERLTIEARHASP